MGRLRNAIPPSLLPLMLLAFLVTASLHAVRPIASYRALELGASAFEVGIVASSFALLSLFAALPIGRRIDRVGEKAVITLGVVLVECGSVAMALAPSIGVLAASQAILGLGHVSCILAGQSLVARLGGRSGRDSRFSTYTLMLSSGQMIGPIIAGLVVGRAVGQSAVGPTGLRDLLLLLSLMLAAALVMAFLVFQNARPTTPRTDADGRDAPPRLWASVGPVLRIKGMPQAMLASVTFLTGVDILVAYLPVYGEEAGLSVQTVGLLLAVRAGASLVVRAFLVPLLATLGRRRLLLLSCAIPAVALGLVPAVGQAPLLFAAMVAAGLGLGLGQPLTLTWVASTAPRPFRGAALGVRVAGNRLAQLTLPGAAGVLAGGLGIGAAFLAVAGLLTFCAGVLLRTNFGQGEQSG